MMFVILGCTNENIRSEKSECYKVLLAVDRDYFGQAEATLAKWRTNSRKTTLEDLILSDAALTTEHLTGTVDVGTGPVRASAVLASFASHHLLLLHWSLLCKYLANIMKAGGELILAAPQQVVAAETQVVERGGEMIIVGGAARAREATLLSHILDNLSAYLMSYGETVAAILKILGRSVSSQCPPRLDKWWRDALKNENKIGKSKEEVDEVVQFADEIKRSISKREGTVKTQLSEDLKMLAWCAGLYDDWISPLLPTQASASSPPPGVIFLRSFQVLDIKVRRVMFQLRVTNERSTSKLERIKWPWTT
ncbi:hypothetical protein DFJ73DRAFT_131782 [Zopfochytrium polystomum]|nr:hypothetical protein DFJ73DRAFT_131782 [Zopfochytrium polystomum]